MGITRTTRHIVPGLFLLATCAAAQEYRGTISGTVSDPSGAVIPGANVEAKSGEQTYTVKSDNAGRFVVPFAQPNTYTITVAAPGFASGIYTATLQVSSTVDIPAKLRVSSNSNEVTVSTDQFLLSTADASGGTVLTRRRCRTCH